MVVDLCVWKQALLAAQYHQQQLEAAIYHQQLSSQVTIILLSDSVSASFLTSHLRFACASRGQTALLLTVRLSEPLTL